MKLPQRIIILSVFCLLISISIGFSSTQKHVLIINSYHRGLSWTDDSTVSEMNTIRSGYKGDVKFYVEYMDWKEHPTEEMKRLFKEQIAYKYKDILLDVIIAGDDAAFSFTLDNRESLFGDTPVIFQGISESSYKTLVKERINLTGVIEIVDIETTIEVAQMVNPNMSTFYIIHDQTESGRSMGNVAANQVRVLYPKLNVVIVTDQSIEEIIKFVGSLTSKDSILMTAYYTDINGENIDFEDMIEKVSESTSAAVFSLYDFAIGTGAIGGNLLSAHLIGERAGELAIDILNGADADTIPLVRDGMHINAIDYKAAIQFKIDFKNISEEVQIINRPISIFETYKSAIIMVIGLITIMGVFLVILSYYLRKTLNLKNDLSEKNSEQMRLNDELSASEEELKAQFEALNELFDELQLSKEKNELILDAIKDTIIDWNIKDNTFSMSEKWEELLGYSIQLVDTPRFILNLVHEEDMDLIKAYYDVEQTGFSDDYLVQIRLKIFSGEYKWYLVKGIVRRDPKGYPMRMISAFTDIDALKQLEGQMRYTAYHDQLTGFANKSALEANITKAFSKGIINYGILLIDIDHFKRINDTMGHVFGDKYIKSVGELIHTVLQKDEALRRNTKIYRINGDEFVLYYRTSELTQIAELANFLIQHLNDVIEVEYSNFSNSVSIGYAIYPEDGDTLEVLLTKSDLAMYKAKEEGRGRAKHYETSMYERIIWRVEREDALKNALIKGELSLVYQPVVNCNDQKIIGFEALLRWQHPTLGNISPLDFIPIAEESQLIMPIGKWVINEALSFLKEIQLRQNKSYHMAVNVSVLQLIQEDFEKIVSDALLSFEIDPAYFIIEITETVLMQTVETTTSKLSRLRELGLKIALDDFGTGYSSLSYLKTLPIDILKIDKSFIDELGQSKEHEDLVQVIVLMGQQLNMKLVAEGVESVSQWESLKTLQCDYMQGYYFSKPLTAEQCNVLIES